MPNPPRVNVKRLLLVVLLALVLGLLLEMNRWLPGGWPGGGGSGGFRELKAAASPGAGSEGLTAPLEPSPTWRPEQGVTLEVLGPEGAPAEGFRAAVGADTAFDGPERGGRSLRLPGRDVFEQGVRVMHQGAQVRHVPPAGLPPTPLWRVFLPRGRPELLRSAQPLTVRVLDAVTGAPVPTATVYGPVALQGLAADAQGQAVLTGLKDRAALRVTAPGYYDALPVAHPGAAGPHEVRLSPRQRVALRFVDGPDGAAATVSQVEVRDAQDRVLWRSAGPAPGAAPPQVERAEVEVPGDRVAGARLLVEAPGRPRTEVPLPPEGGAVALAPLGRRVEVLLRDAQGRPVPARRATLRYDADGPVPGTESAGVERSLEPAADGTLVALVPARGEATLLVESAEHAPVVVRVGPGDSAGPREATVERGLRVPVQVLDARGRPVREAEVRAAAVVRGLRVEVQGRTDAEGLARVGPLPPGPVELFARAAGRAWNGTTTEAAAAMGTVELRLFPGAALRLVVESATGAPLEGVSVVLSPADDGPPDVRPPEAAPGRTDREGLLVVEDLPARAYRARLTLPGHGDEVLHDLRPGAVTYFATLLPTPR